MGIFWYQGLQQIFTIPRRAWHRSHLLLAEAWRMLKSEGSKAFRGGRGQPAAEQEFEIIPEAQSQEAM